MTKSKITISLLTFVLVLSVGACGQAEDEVASDDSLTTNDELIDDLPLAASPSELFDIIYDTGIYTIVTQHDSYEGMAIIPDSEYSSVWNEDLSDEEKIVNFESNYADTIELASSTIYVVNVTYDYLIMVSYDLGNDGNYHIARENIYLNKLDGSKGYYEMYTYDGSGWGTFEWDFYGSSGQGWADDGHWVLYDDFYFSGDDFIATGESVIGEDGLTYDVYEMDKVGWFSSLGAEFIYEAMTYYNDLYYIQKDGTYFNYDNQTLTSLFSWKGIVDGRIHDLLWPGEDDDEETWEYPVDTWEVDYSSEEFTSTVFNVGVEDVDATEEVFYWWNYFSFWWS